MYGLGLSEIAVILLVMLLFFKPEDIFSFFRKTGQWYSRLNKMEKEMEELINREITDPSDDEKFGFDTDQDNNERFKGKERKS